MGTVLNLQLCLLKQFFLKVAKLASLFSKMSSSGEKRGQKERSGTSKILPERLRVFPLHLWPLAAFLWDKYLTSSLVRFSSQFVQSVSINIYPSSQAVSRAVCLLQGCRVGATMPSISLMPLLLNCGHSSDWCAAGGPLVWTQSKTPVNVVGTYPYYIPYKGCSTEMQRWRTKPSNSCLADLYRQHDKCITSLTKQV